MVFELKNFHIVSASDDAMSLAKIDNTQGVFTINDQRADGNYVIMLKFDMTDGSLLENYSIKIDCYPSGTHVTSGDQLNIYGYNPTQDQVAFIRVGCLQKH